MTGTSGIQRRGWKVLALVLVLAAAVVGGLFGADWLNPPPLRKAEAAYARKDWSGAADAARQALKENPGEPEALKLMARASARLGRSDFALSIFDRFGPEQLGAEDFFLVGNGLVRQGRHAAGREAFEMGLKADPDHPEILYELGRVYMGFDRLAAATDLARRLVPQPGWEVRGHVMMGLLCSEQSDPEGAAKALAEAMRRDPDLKGVTAAPGIRKLLVRALLQLHRPQEAAEALRRVLAADPLDAEAHWLASRVALQQHDLAAAGRALEEAERLGYRQPAAFEPSPFVGSARCASCHQDLHRSQQNGRHSKTFRPESQLSHLTLPEKPLPDPRNPKVVHALQREDERVAMVTKTEDQTLKAWLTYAVGSGDRGLTPIGRDAQGKLHELRLSYYGDIKGWDCTTGHPDIPETYLGEPLSEDLLRRCLGCHATDWRAARDGIGPTAMDRGIGCERCHGPGGNHIEAVDLKFRDLAIGQPKLVSPAESTRQLCARCHSPRGRSFSAEDEASVRFQALTLSWSRCSTESRGAMGCVTCHNPHRDAETDPSYYDARCLVCHTPKDQPAPPSPRGSHPFSLPEGVARVACPVNPTSNCTECHMPYVKGAVPHTVFTDHHIRIHREGEAKSAAAE